MIQGSCAIPVPWRVDCGDDYAGGHRPPKHAPRVLVYRWCMGRTNIDIDEEACDTVMRRYRLASKREAVNFALRTRHEALTSIEPGACADRGGRATWRRCAPAGSDDPGRHLGVGRVPP